VEVGVRIPENQDLDSFYPSHHSVIVQVDEVIQQTSGSMYSVCTLHWTIHLETPSD
jgi:hypothetical protein